MANFKMAAVKSMFFPRNVLLNMVFLNVVSQARFECLILHFIVRSSIYKCWNVIFRTQSNMADGIIKKMYKISHFLANILDAHVLSCKKPHDRYHLV